MGYPDLGTWNEKRPNEAEADAVETTEQLAWTTIDNLTAGRIAFGTTTIRPTTIEDDGSISLPHPAGDIVSIRIDGVTFNAWQQDGYRLYRMDGDSWPTNDDMTLVSGAVGTFEITFYQGWQPGRLLVWAAGELASEFYKAAAGDKKCRLPKNVTSIVRQGVSFEIQTPLFTDGKTGIVEIDVVLARYNPAGATSLPSITSVETIARAARRF